MLKIGSKGVELPVFMKKIRLDLNNIPRADTILRVFGFIFFLLFLGSRFLIYKNYGGSWLLKNSPAVFLAYKLLWVLETLIFLVYVSAYIFRHPARKLASGLRETFFPFVTAALPFLMIRHSIIASFFPGKGRPLQDLTRLEWFGKSMYVVDVHKSVVPLAIIILVMLSGTVIMLVSLASLWRSFSIMVEARQLVTRGIYKYVRHPLYLGEIVSYAGVLMMRFSLVNTVIFIVFIIFQVVRSRIEEQKLEKVFPEYRKYKKRTGIFFPRIGINN